MKRRSRAKLWGLVGLFTVFGVGYYFIGRERVIPVGVAIPNLIRGPMSAADAARTLKTINDAAQVAVRGREVTVQISAAAFPLKREGQLALAQQYARADEIVKGGKRAINFLDPDGKSFARADPDKGVVMTR
jgi:hypothetical protein